MSAEKSSARLSTSVRLPEDVEAAVRASAAASGRSISAEMIALIQRGLSGPSIKGGDEPEIRALKIVTAALADSLAWTVFPNASGEAKHAQALLGLYRVAADMAFTELSASEPSPEDQEAAKHEVRRLLAIIRAGRDPLLAEAGRIFGITKEQRS